jgi:uncharacterized protein involved in type VI secretion and phage assembly
MDYEDDLKLPSSEPTLRFKGIVTGLSISNYHGSSSLVISGKSTTVLMDDGPTTRSFTDKKLQEIVDTVFKEYSFPNPVYADPKDVNESFSYIVQYEESNFQFLKRLADRNGEWFYYDGLELFFGKPNDNGDPLVLDFSRKSGLIDFNIQMEALPSLFSYDTYDYIKDKKASILPSINVTTGILTQLDDLAESIFPNTVTNFHVPQIDDHEVIYLMRREEISVDEQLVVSGSSRNPNLKIGMTFKVKDNGPGQEFGEFIIVSLHHSISQGGDYMNHFEACSAGLSSPPLSQTYASPYCGAQLAIVKDVDDDKKLGRVRVQFMWQSGEEKSPWIRVASPYTGKDKGFYIVPEKGDQVLVAFENNNPEKPYVLSGMYHGNAKPEWFHPQNKFKGFKSRGKNELKFDDEAKIISLNAPSEIHENAKKIILTGSEEISLISGNSSIVLKKDGTISISGTKIVEIKTSEISGDGTSKITLGTATSEVKIEGLNTSIKAGLKMESSGTNIELKGTAGADINGGLSTNIKGVMVNINS